MFRNGAAITSVGQEQKRRFRDSDLEEKGEGKTTSTKRHHSIQARSKIMKAENTLNGRSVHLGHLDGLRALAAIWVVLHHSYLDVKDVSGI